MSNLPDWARALGPPLFAARIRAAPEDFCVTEQIDITFSDDGEHDWLWVQKSGANTYWVAEQLARHAGVSPRDVGYAGLKDRHAVTRQWFSVRRPSLDGTDWDPAEIEGAAILRHCRHRRKLRRGGHRGNAFRVALRSGELESHREAIAARLTQIEARGVPDYFGEQRFGREGSNIELGRAVLQGRRVSRNKRSIAISAVRSLLFNDILDARVRDGTWDKILLGELANLDGSGSVFAVQEDSAELHQRCADFDIHPTGTLWGRNAPLGTRTVADLETRATAPNSDLCEGLVAAKVDAASRPLRLRVQNLTWKQDDQVLWLEFELRKGSYATSVLREIAATYYASCSKT